jgi:Arc/MetJ-type ribon-helix-helix transcriptional regulator
MKRYSFFLKVEMLRKIKAEVKAKGFDSVSSFLRKLITDYFENK